MSDRYPFSGDKTLITHDGNVVWNEQVAVQASLDFSNVTDSTLTDSINESYATAVEDNETQYLSILETTNDITLESLHNLTLGNSKIVSQENLELNENVIENPDVNVVNMGDQQVVIFSLEGSDDLYGIQLAQDEEGNIQKYQFKFRTTADGQLEAIPESIQLLPNEEEINEKVNEGNQIFVQDVENEETELQETQVIFQEESDVEETQVYVHEEEDMTEELVQMENDEKNVKILIKNEPDQATMCLQADDSDDEREYVENAEVAEEREDFQDGHEDLQYVETETVPEAEDNYEEETIDIKAGILEDSIAALRNSIVSPLGNVKEEMHHEDSQEATLNEESETEEYIMYKHQVNFKETHYEENHECEEAAIDIHGHESDHYEAVEVDGAQETVLEYQQYASAEDIQQVYEETDTMGSQNLIREPCNSHYEQLFIQESHIRQQSLEKSEGVQFREEDVIDEEEEEELEEQFATETGPENDSDNDDYQIVEGLHITAEGDIGEDSTSVPYQESETILQEVTEKPPAIERANILKQTSVMRGAKDVKTKNNRTVVYYVVPHPEKENVNSLPVNNTVIFRSGKSNPRSILKSSFSEGREVEPEHEKIVDERLNKRFARSKEAVQARLFNNFINKTTIPHAPVRQTRLPRKQEIKPVDNRRDEEIIVQEVMVFSNRFIGTASEKLKTKDKLEITGYVVLSDSDDDYDPKHGTKKKKKHKKHKIVDVSDSDESDLSIIEILQSDEEEEARKEKDNPKRGRGRPRKSTDSKDTTMDNMKRRRGRPPKSSHSTNSDSEESPLKKSRTESEESDTAKKEIKCPHCTKTFPSQNSLSTHIQHHNLENSLRNSQASKASAKSVTTVEYKHKCDDCQTTFKNSILLKRHVCQKQAPKMTKRLICTVCKKTFPDVSTLNVHKRCHIKENLMKTTTVAQVSPKKFLPRPSTSQTRLPQKQTSSRTTLKCKECSRQCFSQESLSLHEKTHKKHTCLTCNASFPSRLLLDTHTRVSCVKTASPMHRRLSFKIKKSFVHSPKRRTMARLTRKSTAPSGSSTNMSDTLNLNVECEVCGEKFTMFQDKFKHQVKVHGLKTPDKSILEEQKKLLHKPKNIHGGIPAREGMRKVFADIRTKIALITPKKDAM